jgi:2-iminobutanoate/2-iminopropanoate deaminase
MLKLNDTMKRHEPATVWQVPQGFRGVYAHAVQVRAAARMLLISGQIGVEPDGSVPVGFSEQCERAMTNVEALLVDADMAISDIVKVNYYLIRPVDLPNLAEIRTRRWASDEPPAVTTLVVAALARPELLIEIEVTAASARPEGATAD